MADYIDKKRALLQNLLEIVRKEQTNPYYDKETVSLEFELKTGLSHKTALKYINMWENKGMI